MNPKAKGEKTEAILLAEFVKRDIPVLLPFGDNQPYDMVIDLGGKLIRLQCKTGRVVEKSIDFNTSKTRSNARGCSREHYESGQFDFYAVYCSGTERCYIVPFNKCGKTHTTLALDCENARTAILAEDVELDRFLNSIAE